MALLSGQSYYALGLHDKALEDFLKSAHNGKEYLNSLTYRSSPFSGKNQAWERTFSLYFSNMALTQIALGKCTEALESYTIAINIGYRNLFPKGISKKLDATVAKIFADENVERREYLRSIGSFFSKRSLVNKSLGNDREAKEDLSFGEMFKYDRTKSIKDHMHCLGP